MVDLHRLVIQNDIVLIHIYAKDALIEYNWQPMLAIHATISVAYVSASW